MAEALTGAGILGEGLVLPDPAPAMLPPAVSERLTPGPCHTCSALPPARSLSPRALRRLGRAQRLALAAAERALDAAGEGNRPSDGGAVVVGTGLGCLGETAAFLENMVQLEGREPKPAAFIQSVHNAPAAQLAICFGLRGENQTFTHGAISFELALGHALWVLRAGRSRHVLAVGVDEASPYAITAGQEAGWLRREPEPLMPMAEASSRGTLPGEGAAGLLLGPPAPGVPRLAVVRARPLPHPDVRRVDPEAEVGLVRDALTAAGTSLERVDLLLLGANGFAASDQACAQAVRALRAEHPAMACGVYKHLCGEFGAAPALGVALAARSVREGALASQIRCLHGGGAARPVARAVVYHLHESGYHSVCVVTR